MKSHDNESFTNPRRFELIDEQNFRFWTIWIEDLSLKRQFGVIGRPGRILSTNYETLELAIQNAEKFIDDKWRDGYIEAKHALPEKIQNKSLARLERSQSNGIFKKAIRIYANSSRLMCTPKYSKQNPGDHKQRAKDQILGGLPFLSEGYSWPTNEYGDHMQFIAQIDLDNASKLIDENIGSGLLQVWAKEYEMCDDFMIRVIDRNHLNYKLTGELPEYNNDMNEQGLINFDGIGNHKRSIIDWKLQGEMYYPNITDRINEPPYIIDPLIVGESMCEIDNDHEWKKGLIVPEYEGLRGRDLPAVYLGGYPFAEGNGWNLHSPSRRSILNIVSDADMLWHLCVFMDEHGRYHADVSCTR